MKTYTEAEVNELLRQQREECAKHVKFIEERRVYTTDEEGSLFGVVGYIDLFSIKNAPTPDIKGEVRIDGIPLPNFLYRSEDDGEIYYKYVPEASCKADWTEWLSKYFLS